MFQTMNQCDEHKNQTGVYNKKKPPWLLLNADLMFHSLRQHIPQVIITQETSTADANLAPKHATLKHYYYYMYQGQNQIAMLV